MAAPPVLSSTPNLIKLSIPVDAVRPNEDVQDQLFTPSLQLDSSFAPPDLSLPDLPYESSPSPAYSPTPPASQISGRGPRRDRLDTPTVHDMLVDDATPERHQDAVAHQIPVGLLKRPIEATEDSDDEEPDVTPMSVHLANSEGYQNALLEDQPNIRNPLDKYMKEVLPIVHDAHPAAPLDHIDMKTIKEWDSCPNYRLIAAPFGFDAHQQFKHNNLKKRILAAVAEITQSPRVGVCAPGLHDRVVKSRHRTPRAFLIHGLNKDQYRMLLKQKVWASAVITFRVTTTTPTSPDLLFTLTEFSTLDVGEISAMVQDLWQKNETLLMVQDAIEGIPIDVKKEALPDIKAFLDSVKIDQLKMMESGGRLTPHYNVYANAKFLQNHTMWSKARGVLSKLYYGTSLLGSGVPLIRAHHCNICHSTDHPRGFCPFAKLLGWKGPNGLADTTRKNDETRNASPSGTQRR